MDKDVSYSGLLVKSLKVLYAVFGYLPAVWLLSFFALMSVAMVKLGVIPHHMQSPDPASLGMDSYAYMTAMLGVMALLSMIAWPLLSLVILLSPFKKEVLTAPPLICFLIGTAGYLFLEFQLPTVLTWVTG